MAGEDPSEDPRRSVLLLEAGADYPTLDVLPDPLKYGHTRAAERVAEWI
jgi:hypothetical protein